jgi:hypothetical protein
LKFKSKRVEKKEKRRRRNSSELSSSDEKKGDLASQILWNLLLNMYIYIHDSSSISKRSLSLYLSLKGLASFSPFIFNSKKRHKNNRIEITRKALFNFESRKQIKLTDSHARVLFCFSFFFLLFFSTTLSLTFLYLPFLYKFKLLKTSAWLIEIAC